MKTRETKKGGEVTSVTDVSVKMPETETYMIQELHLPIYHCWCLMLENRFFGRLSKKVLSRAGGDCR